MTDKKLIQKSIQGDHQAFKKLVLKFGPLLLTTCKRYTPISVPAEDILQESFIKIYQNLDKIDLKKEILPYFHKICINTALSKQLKVKRRKEKLEGWYMDNDDFHGQSAILSQLEVEEIMQMLKSIPKLYSDVFNLIVVEGYPHKEVGELLKISESTSRVYLTRARKLLQDMLTDHKVTKSTNERI